MGIWSSRRRSNSGSHSADYSLSVFSVPGSVSVLECCDGQKKDTFPRYMKRYVKLYLESILIRAFGLVREIKAGFLEEVLSELKFEIDIGMVDSRIRQSREVSMFQREQ